MKLVQLVKHVFVGSLLIITFAHCERNVTDFGFDGSISGAIKDQTGSLVFGTTTSNNLIIQALGETDKVANVIRIKGDGTYQYTKLFPTKYRIWITGPATLVGDTVRIDLGTERIFKKDLVVVPFITLKTPTAGTPAPNSVSLTYEMAAAAGKTMAVRELYCSTIPYPDASTGSGPYYDTKKVTLTADKGTATITGLTAKTKYFIRIGARVTTATGFNYSDQITVTTP